MPQKFAVGICVNRKRNIDSSYVQKSRKTVHEKLDLLMLYKTTPCLQTIWHLSGSANNKK